MSQLVPGRNRLEFCAYYCDEPNCEQVTWDWAGSAPTCPIHRVLMKEGTKPNVVALSATDARLCDIRHNKRSVVLGHKFIERC